MIHCLKIALLRIITVRIVEALPVFFLTENVSVELRRVSHSKQKRRTSVFVLVKDFGVDILSSFEPSHFGILLLVNVSI